MSDTAVLDTVAEDLEAPAATGEADPADTSEAPATTGDDPVAELGDDPAATGEADPDPDGQDADGV